jgi:hypothetical protein
LRSISFQPSPTPPVSPRDLARYAGKWVVVRAGKVVLQAMTFDELAQKRKSGGFKDGDRILHLPPATPH